MNEEMKNCCAEYKKYVAMVVLPLVAILGVWMLVKVVRDIKTVAYVGKAPTTVNTISVSGKGEVVAKPDLATVTFSTTAEDLDVSKATGLVNTYMVDIVASLKSNGVDEKDIKTTGYNIYPRYDYIRDAGCFGPKTNIYTQSFECVDAYGKQVLVAYNVTQSISLKIRDLSKAGKIISDLGKLKVTDMSGLTFTNDKQDDLEKEARYIAIKQARDEAKKLASELGVSLGDIVSFSDGRYYPTYYKSAVSDMMGVGGGAPEATVPAGENTITSNVTIVYEII